MPRAASHRPTFFGYRVSRPYGAVRGLGADAVIYADTPLHEQVGPDEPEYDSLRDWFVSTSTEPLDEGRGTPLRGLVSAYVYRYVHPDITSHHMLSVHAGGDQALCAIFGMDADDPLSHSTLARNYWHRLNSEARSHLHLTAARRAVEAAKAGLEVLWATNSDSLNDDNIVAHGMLYRIRWSIETSYRVAKEHFKASTTSISQALRVWVWKLALVFYNAWVLLRILIRKEGFAVEPTESAIGTHSFQRILKTEYG